MMGPSACPLVVVPDLPLNDPEVFFVWVAFLQDRRPRSRASSRPISRTTSLGSSLWFGARASRDLSHLGAAISHRLRTALVFASGGGVCALGGKRAAHVLFALALVLLGYANLPASAAAPLTASLGLWSSLLARRRRPL